MAKMTVGFIGAGQMARALASGFVAAELLSGKDLVAFDPIPDAHQAFTDQIPGARGLASNVAVVEEADVIFLAVKPQSLNDVLHELAATATEGTLFVSILAGIPLSSLCAGLKTKRVVRVMPNTPCLIGQGAAGFALGPGVSQEDGKFVERLLQSVGVALPMKEALLDAVTGLSGSGPAYVYTMIEALSDGGVRAGLPRNQAAALAAQTVLGAAAMIVSTGEHPGVLKDRVTSPGGTTIAGLQVLERRGVRSALIDAVEAATQRSRELGQSQ